LDASVLSAADAHVTIRLLSCVSLHPFSWGGGIFIFYEDFPFGNFWTGVWKHGSKKFQ
jgi:hypothetical protein